MSDKHTYRDQALHRALINRLSRIEGQVRGVKNMVENDIYCIDILNQTAAIRSALNAFSATLLEQHIRSCVKAGVGRGDEEVIEELVDTIKKLTK
ncbi:MAG: metal-sensing transcriptional repressor [Clostridiales bacterium]|nr:metal-sensing transcriptional repressor [Clostridiales bacterium]